MQLFVVLVKHSFVKRQLLTLLKLNIGNIKKIDYIKNYIEDIKNYIGKVDYIFIATEPDGMKFLHDEGFDITLVYPKNELRNEYLDRYIERDSPYDFIGTFMKHWHIWLNELKEQKYCRHIVLESGQYLQDVLLK